MGSRPSSPPPRDPNSRDMGLMSEEDKDRQALMMGPLGGDKSREQGGNGGDNGGNAPLSAKEQGERVVILYFHDRPIFE